LYTSACNGCPKTNNNMKNVKAICPVLRHMILIPIPEYVGQIMAQAA
jgi:hypothetical protein